MRQEIQERICDECGKKKKMVKQFGATPFKGWIKATIEGNDGLSSSLDFCSPECAGKHFTLWKEVSNASDDSEE